MKKFAFIFAFITLCFSAIAHDLEAGRVITNKLEGKGGTPTISLGTEAGTGATYSITGTDVGFTVTLNRGTSPAIGSNLFTVTYASRFDAVPRAVSLFENSDSMVYYEGNYYYYPAALITNQTENGFVVKLKADHRLVSSTYKYVFTIVK